MKNKLFELALEARNHSYSPYSHAQVGAALVLENGKTYSGANIENASYGATVCAERVAIWKAVSESGPLKIREITVTTKDGWPPCGLCRQVLAEFSEPTTLIHVGDLKGVQKTWTMKDLLPEAFTPKHLLK
jgi:cytidine deaminase